MKKKKLFLLEFSQRQQLFVCFIALVVIIFSALSLFFLDKVLAATTTTKYACDHTNPNSSIPNNGYSYTVFTNGIVVQSGHGSCSSTQYCDSTKTGSSTNPCVTIVSSHCTCSQSGALNGQFSCDSGKLIRSCGGSNPYCINGASQGGLWPCSINGPTCAQVGGSCYVGNGVSGSYSCPSGTATLAQPYSTEGTNDCTKSRGSGYVCCWSPCQNATQNAGYYCGSALTTASFFKNWLFYCSGNHGVADLSKTHDCGNIGCKVNPGQADTCSVSSVGITPPAIPTIPGGGESGGGGSGGGSCAPTVYRECEAGNPTACLNKVGKGNVAQVTHNCDGTYSCTKIGPCATTPTTPILATPTNTPIPGVPTDTPIPAGSTNTPVPSGDASLSLALQLPGVGNINGGNPHPIHPTRQATLYIYTPDQDPSNVNDKPIIVKTTISLNTSLGTSLYGYFVNAEVAVGHLSGDYQIFIKSNQYVRTAFIDSQTSTNDFTLTPQQTTILPPTTLIAGDIFPPPATGATNYGDDTLDISDYNMLLSCYGSAAATTACPSKSAADLNDDGTISGIDYNIMLRSFSLTK